MYTIALSTLHLLKDKLWTESGEKGRNFPCVFDASLLHYPAVSDEDIEEIVEKCKVKAKTLLSDKEEMQKIVGYIDLTTLAGDDTPARVEKLVNRAVAPLPSSPETQCAAVCVYPLRVHDARQRLNHYALHKHTPALASVAGGFPSGQYRLESRLLEVELAVKDGATEIDIVINRAAALQGIWREVYEEVKALRKACGRSHLKTILAVGELVTKENVFKASMAAILAGSDFIKTSTGKETKNANLPDSYVMCIAIKRYYQLTGIRVGFKPAGGLKTAEDALQYRSLIEEVLGKEWLNPSLFRIGASSLLDDVLKRLE